jgi:hypothetical protein
MLNGSPEAERELQELRRSYEPYVIGLSKRLVMPAPPWRHVGAVKDNWQTSPRGQIGAHL